ncbi:hypothetical protein [Roseateles paludis]|jgi:hypothetical protein|uniref:MarR family transcriptional regulator n=1 Tax=Roseateles paludis TaxID=3145238 RepID=A0ABV0FZ13_9BURK
MYLLLAHLQIASLAERRMAELASELRYVHGGQTKVLTANQAIALGRMLKRTRDSRDVRASAQSIREIASKLGWSRTNTQACLAPLIRDQLLTEDGIERKDARVPLYCLSAAGIDVAGRARMAIARCDAELKKQFRQMGLAAAPSQLEGAAEGLAMVWMLNASQGG